MRCSWPDDLGPCEVRFIEVPPEIHARYDHGKALPLYQMIAKNVGIRRARGRFVLATNIDILFSSELAAFLGKQQLDGDRMYRIDRHDAMNDVPIERPIEEQLEYCRTHLIRVNTREGTFNVSRDGRPTLSPGDVAPPESGLLFGPGWFAVESHIKGENFRWASESAELLLPAARDAGALFADDSRWSRARRPAVCRSIWRWKRRASRWRAWRSTGAVGCACRWRRRCRRSWCCARNTLGAMRGARSAPAVLPRLPHGLGAAAAQGDRGRLPAGLGASRRASAAS